MVLYFSEMLPSRREKAPSHPQLAAKQGDFNMRILSAWVLSVLGLVFINNPDHFGFMTV